MRFCVPFVSSQYIFNGWRMHPVVLLAVKRWFIETPTNKNNSIRQRCWLTSRTICAYDCVYRLCYNVDYPPKSFEQPTKRLCGIIQLCPITRSNRTTSLRRCLWASFRCIPAQSYRYAIIGNYILLLSPMESTKQPVARENGDCLIAVQDRRHRHRHRLSDADQNGWMATTRRR